MAEFSVGTAPEQDVQYTDLTQSRRLPTSNWRHTQSSVRLVNDVNLRSGRPVRDSQ